MSKLRNKADLTKESLINLLREIQNDCEIQRRSVNTEIKRRNETAQIETIGDHYQIGKVNNESYKLLDSLIEKKLSVAKIKANVLKDVTKTKQVDEESLILLEEDKNFVETHFKSLLKK